MAIVPNDTRFIGINPTVNLRERRSARINRETQPVSMQDITDSVRPYRVYTALVSTMAELGAPPTVIELENTIGAVLWSYTDVGVYGIESEGLFNNPKTAFFISGLNGNGAGAPGTPLGGGTSIVWINGNSLQLLVTDVGGTPIDNALFSYPIEIRVYN